MVSRQCLAIVALVAATSVPAAPTSTSVPAVAISTSVPEGWREAPAMARLFTPKQVPEGSYRVYVTSLGLETAIAQLKRDPALTASQDAWRIESQYPLDVLGQGGNYNRWSV